MALYHSSCVVFNDHGILIHGSSGSGKSDLALRLIDEGAILVSDDYVEVEVADGKLIANTAPNIDGLIEVRGIGLMKTDFVNTAQIHLALELVERDEIERLPEQSFFEHEGISIPQYKFDAFSCSAVAKVKMILKQ